MLTVAHIQCLNGQIFLKICFYFICRGHLSSCMPVYHMFVWCLWRLEGGHQCPGTGVIGGFLLPWGCLEQKPWSSPRVASAFHHWAVFAGRKVWILINHRLLWCTLTFESHSSAYTEGFLSGSDFCSLCNALAIEWGLCLNWPHIPQSCVSSENCFVSNQNLPFVVLCMALPSVLCEYTV